MISRGLEPNAERGHNLLPAAEPAFDFQISVGAELHLGADQRVPGIGRPRLQRVFEVHATHGRGTPLALLDSLPERSAVKGNLAVTDLPPVSCTDSLDQSLN